MHSYLNSSQYLARLNDLFDFGNMQQHLQVLFVHPFIEEVKNVLLDDYFYEIEYFMLLFQLLLPIQLPDSSLYASL